jgi:hypothetical protein
MSVKEKGRSDERDKRDMFSLQKEKYRSKKGI